MHDPGRGLEFGTGGMGLVRVAGSGLCLKGGPNQHPSSSIVKSSPPATAIWRAVCRALLTIARDSLLPIRCVALRRCSGYRHRPGFSTD